MGHQVEAADVWPLGLVEKTFLFGLPCLCDTGQLSARPRRGSRGPELLIVTGTLAGSFLRNEMRSSF